MMIRMTRNTAWKGAAPARAGFTLLEILIVVAIIVVLAGVGTFYLLPLLQGSKDDVAFTQCKTIAAACETYALHNNGNPPPTLQALTQPYSGGKAILEPDAIIDPWDKVFQYDPAGPRNGGNRPDVYTTSPDGKVIGNWSKHQQ